jgi:nucleoid DNA-binding protein
MAEKTTEAAKALPKSKIYEELAKKTGLEPKQVATVFKALDELVKEELSKKGGSREFVIPNIVKLKLLDKPATKATKKPNPFKKGEMMDVKAKPASVVVKARILKGLKDIKPATKATKAVKK